jgi:hypothetical protein
MNQNTIIEAVAAGMRAMKKEPAAFIFIDEGLDWTWDQETILGIPVFHANGLQCYRWGTGVTDCPFIPVGRNDSDISNHDRVLFADAYDDQVIK